jgi:hypothetical protein
LIGFKKEAENVVNKFHLPTFSFSIVMGGCPKMKTEALNKVSKEESFMYLLKTAFGNGF